MPQKRIAMERVREVIRLKTSIGMSYREISNQIGVGKTTIGDILADFKRSGVSVEDFEKMSNSSYLEILHKEHKKQSEKYDNLSELFEYIDEELKRPGVKLKILHKEYLDMETHGYQYSRFCHHYRMWRKKAGLSMHLEHKPGDKMFVDYAGKKLCIYSKKDERTEVEVFVAILPSSQLTYAEASLNQQKISFITSNENALHYFGGVVRAIVPDCLKSAVTKADNYEPIINETFEDFARHYGTAVVPARSRKPKDKALVENAVNIIYQRVYAPLRNQKFYSLDDLNRAIRELVELHNNTSFQGRKVTRMSQFNEFEKARLQPLAPARYEMKEIESRRVHMNYHVFIKGEDRYYSVPWKYKGEQVKIIYNSRTVEVYFDNSRIALHVKTGTEGRYVTQKEHMPSEHRFIVDQSEEKLLKWSQNIGAATNIFTRNMLTSKSHPEQAFKSIIGVLNLEKKYSKNALEQACKKAIRLNAITYGFIKNYLKNKQYNSPENTDQGELPFNSTTRGKAYYGGQK